MIKMTILYRQPESVTAFEAFYAENLALLEQIPGIIRRQVNMIKGAPGGHSPYYKSIELYFADADALDTAMTSAAGQAAGQHLMTRAARLVEMFFSEVYEEEGGQTVAPEEVEHAKNLSTEKTDHMGPESDASSA